MPGKIKLQFTNQQTIMNLNIIFAYLIISACAVIMFFLFVWDFRSHKTDNHKDFKSVIVSVGVLGTFIGIVIGLWEFDTSNISSSVPNLLGGLKTAFMTSIMGMGSAIALSIFQGLKNKDKNTADTELNALNHISKQLEDLNFLKEIKEYTRQLEAIPLINTKLDSIDTNIKTLSADIAGVKNELKENQQQLFAFLKDKLEGIDKSLKVAVEKLAEGATQEIIKALEGVIADFNNNLTEQFGDNFKQLNEAVLKMIEWQENYKNSVQQFEKSLGDILTQTETSHQKTINLINTSFDDFSKAHQKTISETIQQIDTTVQASKGTAEQISKITKDYATIADTSEALTEIIKTNQNQINTMKIHLESLATIGKDAGSITEELKNFSKEIQGSLSNQASSVKVLAEDLETQLRRALDELEKTLTSLTKSFAENYKEYLERHHEMTQQNNND